MAVAGQILAVATQVVAPSSQLPVPARALPTPQRTSLREAQQEVEQLLDSFLQVSRKGSERPIASYSTL